MRIIALLFIFITLLLGVFGIYCYNGMQMQILGVQVATAPAAEMPDMLDQLREQLEYDIFTGTRYHDAEISSLGDSYFVTYTVRIENKGILPMDWIRIEIVPSQADLLQLPAERTPTLNARSRSDFSTTLLARDISALKRTVKISYYVMGHSFSVEYVM